MVYSAKFAMALLLLLLGGRQKATRPDVPDKLAAPATEEVVLRARATGFQIYVCQAGSDQKLVWILKAPEADLFDGDGKSIGHHYAGPTWKHSDGSEVTGKVAARQDSPDADAIPWLLLSATGHSGSGMLSRVTTIQRINTKGGQAPKTASCDDSHRGDETKSAYTADYYFYGSAH
jgi:hypothetical protein